MNGKLFFIIVGLGFGMASMWQIVANPTLGTCDCEETREWDASLQEEACECGYSLHEACEFANGINADCGLGLTPNQIQTLKAQTYAAALRWKNNKPKGVADVLLSSADFKGNFLQAVANARDTHKQLSDDGRLGDGELAEALDQAGKHVDSLTFGEVNSDIDLGALDRTVKELGTLAATTNDKSVVSLIDAYCLELESYIDFAQGSADFVETLPGRVIGHLTNPEGSFKTDIIVSNSSGEVREYSLHAYNAQGVMVEEIHSEVGEKQSLTLNPLDMFTAENVSHFQIMDAEGIDFTAKYQTKANGGSVLVKEAPKPSNRWRLFPGDWDIVWDGAAIVNMGHKEATVTIRQFDANNELLHKIDLVDLGEMPPMGKGLVVISNLGFDPVPGSQFQIFATQPIILTALRGTRNAEQTFMWENLAIPD